jgi:hypothetical protein
LTLTDFKGLKTRFVSPFQIPNLSFVSGFLCDVMPCSPIVVRRCYGAELGALLLGVPFKLQDRGNTVVLRNVSGLLPDYTVLRPRTQNSTVFAVRTSNANCFFVKFEVFTVMTKINSLFDVTPSSLVENSRHFGRTSCLLHVQGLRVRLEATSKGQAERRAAERAPA